MRSSMGPKPSLLLFIFSLVVGNIVQAHPVSYKDSVGIMSYNSSQMNELLLTYSLNHRLALGATYIREKKSEMYIPRINFLVNRWNNEDSQANIYLSFGGGQEKHASQFSNVKLAEAVIDWESRKYYTYFEQLYMRRDQTSHVLWPEKDDHHSKLRLGFAPFLAGYSDLNVWAIVQFTKHNDESVETTQLFRFYIKNTLWEIGADMSGGFALNFMIHL